MNKTYITYDGLCSKEETSRRVREKRISKWEKTAVLSEFVRDMNTKIQIRNPQSLLKSVHHLLDICQLTKSKNITQEKFEGDWKHKFLFVSDRLSSVKQEFVASRLGSEHVSILELILKFYLLCLWDENGDFHRCFSEVYSTMNVIIDSCRSISELNSDLIGYYFLLYLDDINVLNKLLKTKSLSDLDMFIHLYFSFVSKNYDRFRRMFMKLDCFQKACLVKHLKTYRTDITKVISTAYRSKLLRYPIDKFTKYCFLSEENFSDFDIPRDEKGIDFSKGTSVGLEFTCLCSWIIEKEIDLGTSFTVPHPYNK